ncbi:ArsR family transcriptional regulator [Streptomyces rapamycinicus NRRL 5491]|uniref:ArsR family transcriptional regulator n=2 Tax=Streptomyces rapamycinicus TaxID=1226757 RepID=A0A0A0NN02_STRRN|nr:ArsR family transcriptional regulator [Streptomyces rapamycinicus NRRL 5491]RLV79391.1 ArsR family transcriptional regulator [Streptomyces rapamycinicus NRRL 5491]
MLTLPLMAENEEPASDEVRVLDPRTLRGLAHPLRMRLLGALREYGPATASQLADRLGESSGATSYHLRQLATYGFVEDDPGRGKGRERWWKATHRGTRWNADKFLAHPDPAVRGAVNTVLHEVATQHTEQMSTWLGTLHEWSEKWVSASDMSDFHLRLTPELAREMRDKVHELIESYREKEVDRETEGSAPYRVHLHAFPRDED